DHRRSETALATDAEWIGIRPGTDGALALGAIHTMIKENLYDQHFVKQWTHGFEELRDYVKSFTPERVEQITWVPADRVRDLGHSIGYAQGCSLRTYSGLEYSNSGVQAIRAVLTLQALGGHLDSPGGKLFQMKNRLKLNRLTTEFPTGARIPIGADEYPIYWEMRKEAHAVAIPKAILHGDPYRIHSMIISGSSIITAWPNPDLWRKAFSALDFLVVVNRFPTADAIYADILLPASTGFEIESYMKFGDHVQIRQRVIEPVGESRNDYLIFVELANRLGYGERWPQTEEALIQHALAGTGIREKELRANPTGIKYPSPKMRYRKYESGELRVDGRPGFETPSGKFEFVSEWFRQYGYDPLPVYTEPQEGPIASPEMASVYPLVFNSGARTQSDFRSQHHNIESLRTLQPHPLVHLHLEDARIRDIQDGDKVFVITPRGRVPLWAKVTEDILKGVVEVNMGGGGPLGPQSWQEANINVLTDLNNRDPISGFPVYKALLCDVIKR
ncbi:MAG: molybdopterin-dependent oxidoreductase, partial [Anaerolineales bacterium]